MLNQFNFKTHDKRFCIMPIDTQNPRMSDLNEIIGYFDFKSVLNRSNITIYPTRASIVNIADYSPFGVQLDGRTMESEDYRYGFNGMEGDGEIKGDGNSINYKYRMYDPRIGRFFSVDRLARKYPMLTPYQFASNTPIQAIDLDGLEAWVVTWASQSNDNGYSRIGHTGIIIKNYREVETQVMTTKTYYNPATLTNESYQVEETITTYEPTGSYTYYDFWPESADLGGKDAIKDGNSVATSQTFGTKMDGIIIKDDEALEAWLSNHDASQIENLENGYAEQIGNNASGSSEGRPSDGIIKLKLTPEHTIIMNNKFKTLTAKNEKYNGISNNCTSFICEGMSSVGFPVTKESIYDWRNLLINEWVTKTFTPNETYKQLSNMKYTNVVKDASNATQESYEEAIIDN